MCMPWKLVAPPKLTWYVPRIAVVKFFQIFQTLITTWGFVNCLIPQHQVQVHHITYMILHPVALNLIQVPEFQSPFPLSLCQSLPEFAQINKVFIHHGNPYFLLTLLETLQFDSHYHSFEIIVKEPEAKIIIGLCDVVECEPLWIIETFEKHSTAFINVRHWVWVMMLDSVVCEILIFFIFSMHF